MLDLLKKGNCTIFAAKIKAWNSWVKTYNRSVPFFFFFAKTFFFYLDAAHNQFYFGCAVCSSCLNFAYCAKRMSPQVNMSSEPTVLNYMPLVVSSEFGRSAQFIIPVKKLLVYIYLNENVSQPFYIRVLFCMVHIRIFITLQ